MQSTSDAFPSYPTSAEGIRDAATAVRGGDLAVSSVLDAIQREHAVAVAAVEGELTSPLLTSGGVAQDQGLLVRQLVIWVAGQLEIFADGVEQYDTGSADPPSIRTLNALWRFCQRTYFTMPPQMYDVAGPFEASAPDTPEEQQAYGENSALYWQQLCAHHSRLEAQLDEVAGEVGNNLDNGPTVEQLLLMWSAGNLPSDAPLIWPNAGLTYDVLTTLPSDLDELSDQELAEIIRSNPGLDPGLYAALVSLRPGLLPALNDAYLAAEDIQPTGNAPTLIGPDGLPYPVGVPSFPPPLPGQQAMGPSLPPLYAGVCGGPFVTVQVSASGEIYLGDPTMRGDVLAWTLVLSGADPVLPADNDPRVAQPSAPYGGPANPLDPNNPLNRPTTTDAAGTGLDLAVAVAEAYAVAEAIEEEETFAYQVFYQVDEAGERRSVIVLTQANPDGSVTQCYGRIDEEGNVVPA